MPLLLVPCFNHSLFRPPRAQRAVSAARAIARAMGPSGPYGGPWALRAHGGAMGPSRLWLGHATRAHMALRATWAHQSLEPFQPE